jgi:hypothetical protein
MTRSSPQASRHRLSKSSADRAEIVDPREEYRLESKPNQGPIRTGTNQHRAFNASAAFLGFTPQYDPGW